MSAATAEAVASPPAPGPTRVSSPTASPSIETAFEHAHGLGERGALRHHGRVDALLDPVGRALGDAEQLDAEAEFVGRGEIGESDRLDALDRDRGRVDPEAEGEGGEDGELVRGVEAADVEGRIGFGVAETLGLGEADVERQVVGLHARQDVVAGAVEDAGDALDRVSGEALAQRLDDRNAAADRGLEEERRVVRFGQRREPHPVRGEHRLVGGDDRQPARQRRLDRLEGGAVRPADQFDEDVDVGGRGHRGGVVEEMRAAEIDPHVAEADVAPVARAVGGEDAFAARARDEPRALPLRATG